MKRKNDSPFPKRQSDVPMEKRKSVPLAMAREPHEYLPGQ
jgi:hypothetical protein